MKKLFLLFPFFMFWSCQNEDQGLKKAHQELTEKITQLEANLKNAQTDQTKFIHTVFFWMNEDVTDEQKAEFGKKGLTELLKVSSIYKGYYGPAAGTPRDVVDNSYDFALVCHFKNAEDQDKYQVDPIHLKFIEDYKDLWKKVQVYDHLVE